ncbi:uncharacterized protein L969DRAFT_88795 [Mixia osmundae IAM 14324]|uniref:uncharacterized protein n=1 Tax=Mixia osmundae (strain CBS 9802 / IAM 14324 / JCM 22182 / KY 12970) TaxID=764103 RepID=UPI0004A55685|nr:uncharacterized protein L969DRAFT_88795 [Mixia osmundae IAM 14324]KEI38358.1 hypothetical protein L969DRAFT_88795 [Mixia osmundae IAM 14324]
MSSTIFRILRRVALCLQMAFLACLLGVGMSAHARSTESFRSTRQSIRVLRSHVLINSAEDAIAELMFAAALSLVLSAFMLYLTPVKADLLLTRAQAGRINQVCSRDDGMVRVAAPERTMARLGRVRPQTACRVDLICEGQRIYRIVNSHASSSNCLLARRRTLQRYTSSTST